ncbi:MAG TPA: FAD binding domain-containing protein, partial [Micromonosporaceae bacterium]
MEFLQPTTWADALAAKAEHPHAVPIAGGTDVMVGLNFGHPAPPALLDLTAIDELAGWSRADGVIRLGAGVTYRQIIDELSRELPALAVAARTVGSPQIRNRATVAGNLGTASPAGDAHPPLLVAGAVVEAASVRGTRLIDIDAFFLGPKRNALAPDELIRAVQVPVAAGPAQFAKVGPRNAMVIAVCSAAVALDPAQRLIRAAIGSAAPTPRRALAAEAFGRDALPWSGGALTDELAREFGARLAADAAPIDDVRGTAAYRRLALSVLGRRLLRWAWTDWTGGGAG